MCTGTRKHSCTSHAVLCVVCAVYSRGVRVRTCARRAPVRSVSEPGGCWRLELKLLAVIKELTEVNMGCGSSDTVHSLLGPTVQRY